MEEEDDARCTQLREVFAEEAEPECALTCGAQGGLQFGYLVLGKVLVAEGLDVAVVLVASAAHHDAECAVVLNVDIHVEVFLDGDDEVLLDEIQESIGTPLT